VRALACLVAIGCTAVAVAGSSAAPPAPASAPYLLGGGSGFQIHSNRDWHGTAGTVGVQEIQPYTNSTPANTDRSYWIGTTTCKPGQKLAVTRSVDLLGPPSSASFAFAYTMYTATTTVLVNGKTVGTATGNNGPPSVPPSLLDAFHDGTNQLTVVVKVASTPTACNAGTQKPSFWFQISGYFATNVSVGSALQGKTEYFKADGGKTPAVIIHVTNHGPDLVPAATFTVQMGGTGACYKPEADGSCPILEQMFVLLAHSDVCTDDKKNWLTVSCSIVDLQPNQTTQFIVVVHFRPDSRQPTWTTEGNSLTWRAQIQTGGPSDTNSSDDSGQASLTFCSSRATDEGCKTGQ